jgi:hypothetical protein
VPRGRSERERKAATREPAGGRLSGKKSQAREKTEEAGEGGHDDGRDIKDVENGHEGERLGDAREKGAKHHGGRAAVQNEQNYRYQTEGRVGGPQ